MRKVLVGLVAAVIVVAAAQAGAGDLTNFANDAYASQITMHVFNKSVKQRMEMARFAFYGGVNAPPAQEAFGDANCRPNAVNVWLDGYTEWGKRKAADGYKFNVGGPALGVDWTNGPLTVGLATTYAWGKMKARDIGHERKTRTWGMTLYGQLNYERFYVNADLSYGRNKYKSKRWTIAGAPVADDPADGKYHSDAWNAEIELGTRLNIKNFLIEPFIGLGYFHDRRKSFTERLDGVLVHQYDRSNYHTLEMPLGVNLGYEICLGNSMIIPRLHFAWIPQFKRKYGTATSSDGIVDDSVKRARHGFELGAGVQTKIWRGVALHVDYNVNMRSKAYEHLFNVGLGTSF